MDNVDPKKNPWKSLIAVRLLQGLSLILGLSVPSLYNYKGLSVLYIIYVFILVGLLITISLVNTILKHENFTEGTLATQVLDIVTAQTLLVASVVSICSATFIKRRNIVKLVRTIERLEKELQAKCEEKLEFEANKLAVDLVFLQAMIHCINIYDLYVNFIAPNYSIPDLISNLLQYIQEIVMSVVILQIHFVCCCIQRMMKYTNRQMYEKIRPGTQYASSKPIMEIEPIFFVRKYDDILHLTEMVSGIYSIQMLLVIIFIILGSILKVHSAVDSTSMTLPTVSKMLQYLTFGIILTNTCSDTVIAVKKALLVCHKILIRFPLYSENPDVRMIKKELLLLAENIQHWSVQFSTELFPFDNMIILIIFEAIATYLIAKKYYE